MTDRELMQQALDALIDTKGYIYHNVLDGKNQYDIAIEALRARLAQPEENPTKLMLIPELMEQAGWVRKKEWEGLTYTEIMFLNKVVDQMDGSESLERRNMFFVRAIEAKLKEKNT